MKISVVTAVYNRVDTIAQAIQSVQSQTYSDIEHIIQDGGSNDGTLEVVERLIPDRDLIQTGRDGGIYDAINRGIQRTTGDVVGLMHSDDFFASHAILERVATAFANPLVQGVYGDLDYVSAADPNRIVRHWQSGDYSQKRLRRGWMPPHPALYLRADVYRRWGLYDTAFKISADYDAVLRYLTKDGMRLAYVPEVFVKMRVGGESNRSLERIMLKSREDLRAIRKNRVGGVGTLAMKNLSKIPQFVTAGFRSV
ncbi:glycosyltransferase [Pseudoruegeria sp. HB172150]|uniref:glycosyltransferase family 2 protein n=1 Tax=Pseudoruegeria sp. HB172150 TaxID=2721164 RepID=UPI0015570FAF